MKFFENEQSNQYAEHVLLIHCIIICMVHLFLILTIFYVLNIIIFIMYGIRLCSMFL